DGGGDVSPRRMAHVHLGLPGLDDVAVARDVLRELPGPPVWTQAVRDHGREPQQLPHRAHHAGRGLAQQPPSLPALRTARLLLVGAGRHAHRADGVLLVRPRPRAPRSPRPRPRRHRGRAEGRLVPEDYFAGAGGAGLKAPWLWMAGAG